MSLMCWSTMTGLCKQKLVTGQPSPSCADMSHKTMSSDVQRQCVMIYALFMLRVSMSSTVAMYQPWRCLACVERLTLTG